MSHHESYIRIFIGSPYNIDLNRFYHLVKIPTAVRNDGISLEMNSKWKMLSKHIRINIYFVRFHHDQHFSMTNYQVVVLSTAVEIIIFEKLVVEIFAKHIWFIINWPLGGAKIIL